MAIAIQPLTKDLLPDWLDFFDNIAFADNPEWADCYCYICHGLIIAILTFDSDCVSGYNMR